MRLKTPVIILSLVLLLNLSDQQTLKIAKIEFEGLTRFSSDEMIETTGLKIGQTFDVATIDLAAQRLIDSGLFKNVAYRTHATRDQITITFQVEEAKAGSSRVVFDNFIWFTETELIAAVRRDVPSFTGAAPDNGDIVERVRHSLRRFLHEHQIEADVGYMASQDSPGSPIQEHVFRVTGFPLPICSLHFPGARNISEAKLIESSNVLLGTEYSNKFASLFTSNSLIPIYREVGQLKAAFSPPLAKPETSATCKSGVDVTIPVDEGAIYKWAGAEWTGISGLTSTELDGVLGMKTGEAANGLQLDKASQQIQKAYGRKGYLQVSVRSVPEFNDSQAKVVFKMDVREGPQFRMGRLIPKGFSDNASKLLTESWGLKTGEPFDDGYSLDFSRSKLGDILRSTFQERRAQGKPLPNVKWGRNINRQSLTVDVTVELTN